MPRPPNRSSVSETLVGWLVLAALAGLGTWVYLEQFTFSPAILTAPASQPAGTAPRELTPPASWTLASFAPPGVMQMSGVERFGAENLSDKIDGRADLYLTAGFAGLQCQRFAEATNRAAWFEVFVYDMGRSRNAYAVYSVQRREDAQDVKLGHFAYGTANGLFFVHGRYYAEIVASEADARLMALAENFSRRFVGMTPAEKADLPEAALFPADGLAPGSIILYPADGFGFDRFKDLFAAVYRAGESDVTAFLLAAESAAQAVELAKAYADFLLANGGAEEKAPEGMNGARMVNLFGTYEIVFSRGPVVAGVHQAEDKAAAEQVAAELFRALGGSGT